MIHIPKSLKLILVLLLSYSVFSQNSTNDLVLKVQNEKIYYQPRNFEEHYDENTPVVFDNIVNITLTNTSNSPYLFVIDTTAFILHDHNKENYEEYNIIRDSTAISNPPELVFRPWLKVYTSAYIPENTGWFFYTLEYKSEWDKRRSESMKKQIKQRDEAYLLYGYLQKEELDDMPEFYYKVKQNQHIIYPKDSLSFSIPVSLPDNHNIYIGEYYKLEGENTYKAFVEFDNQYADLEKILTQEDKDSLKNAGIKIFNGILRSNEIELLPFKE